MRMLNVSFAFFSLKRLAFITCCKLFYCVDLPFYFKSLSCSHINLFHWSRPHPRMGYWVVWAMSDNSLEEGTCLGQIIKSLASCLGDFRRLSDVSHQILWPRGDWRSICSQCDCQPCASPIPASSSTSSGDCSKRFFHVLISSAWWIQSLSTSLWIWLLSQCCWVATFWDQIISSSRVTGRKPMRLSPVICSSSKRRSTSPKPKKWRRIITLISCSLWT